MTEVGALRNLLPIPPLVSMICIAATPRPVRLLRSQRNACHCFSSEICGLAVADQAFKMAITRSRRVEID